jgi:hypothetical protein
VSHALEIRKAIQLDNYHRFFKLYRNTPNMGIYILDLFIENFRVQALHRICKGGSYASRPCPIGYSPSIGFKPQVPVPFVSKELAFDCDELCVDFLKKVNCLVGPSTEAGLDGLQLNTKDSVVETSAVLSKEKLLL